MDEKSEQSRKLVKNYMWWSMGAGLLPIPVAGVAAVTGVQLRMLSKLSEHYEIPFSKERGKATICSLISTLSASTISKGVLIGAIKTIPLLGPLTVPFIMPVVSAAVTYAIGIVFIQHFEAGGTFLDFDPEKTRDFFKLKFDEGLKQAEEGQR